MFKGSLWSHDEVRLVLSITAGLILSWVRKLLERYRLALSYAINKILRLDLRRIKDTYRKLRE